MCAHSMGLSVSEMPCSWERGAIHIEEMNKVMCWEVMGLCNILEQRSSLGDWSLNPSAACFYSLCHIRLVEAREFRAGGGDFILEGGIQYLRVFAQRHR